MLTVTTKVRVAEDGTLEARVPTTLPPGEHEAVIVVNETNPDKPKFRVADLPVHPGPWDHTVSLRREDMYGDDGR
jgi:hypothetical protein